MRLIIISSTMAALLCTTALADTSSMSTTATGMGVLENNYVKAGVNGTTGTLGSGGNTSPGLLYDSTGSGTFNTSYDYLTPGSPFDGFAIKIDGTNSTNNNGGGSATWTDADGLTDGDGTLTWTGTNSAHSGWEIQNTYSLGATSEHIEIGTQITAGSDATALSFGRFIDPDARAADGDSSSTDNVLGYGVIPDSNVAFSEALSSRYALGLYSTDSNVDAGITGWTTDADSYTENAVDGDGSKTNTGDNTIGLSWNWSSVSSGDILTASYAYIFGPSAFDAADAAITAGAGGGADTSSWGTLEDVGSATDAAEGTSEPTVTSTSDPVITYGTWGDWAHDADLPILTQAQTTHDSSVAIGVQTIARETTTIVTTPEERSRTSTTSVVDTYSDSSTVTRTTATGTDTETRNNAVSTVTDPGAFVGRMDQADQMLTLDPHKGVGIAEGFSAGRITHDMAHGYSAESNVFGLGHTTTTDDLLSVGLGINRITTDITGSDSTGSMSTTVLSVRASKHIDDRDMTVSGTVNTSNTDLSYTRTIGDFSAAGSTTSSDRWATLTVEKSTGTVRPFAGVTMGTKSHEAYAETGDVQAALLDAGNSETYRYPTIGINIDNDIVTASFARDFDDAGTTRIGLGLNRAVNETIGIEAGVNRVIAGDNTSTTINAGLTWKF
jgi:hypothetical protein